MPIPNLKQNGLLPIGEHICTPQEFVDTCGQWPNQEWRQARCRQLEGVIRELKEMDIAKELIVDGSFITDKQEPSDIDVFIILRNSVKWETADLMIPRMEDLNKPGRYFWFGYPKIHIFFDHMGTDHFNKVVFLWQTLKGGDLKIAKGYIKVKL